MDEQITKEEFDSLARMGAFADGPFILDRYGEPCQPDRKAWGTLKNGRRVWAYLRASPGKVEFRE